MSTIPVWLAATSGYPANAGTVAQFLGAHNSVFLYSGAALITQQATGSGTYQGTNAQWLSQSITTGNSQTGIGAVALQLSVVGGSPTLPLVPVLAVSLYADSGGLPTGSALASAVVSGQSVYSAGFWVTVPLQATVTPATAYHVVTALVGSSSHYYAWQQSNQPGGGATAPDGATWTAQPYGLMYQVYDQTSTGQLVMISEDGGQMLTQFTYNSLGQIATVTQTVVSQGGYIQSSGTLSYTNGLLTGVS